MPLQPKYKVIGAFCYHIYSSITYRNLGYDKGLSQNDIVITRHTHTSDCYCQGSMYVTNKIPGSGTNYEIQTKCSSCGATARTYGHSNWYNSYSIGQYYNTHYGSADAFAWTSGTLKKKLCSYDNNQIISIQINGIEYLN